MERDGQDTDAMESIQLEDIEMDLTEEERQWLGGQQLLSYDYMDISDLDLDTTPIGSPRYASTPVPHDELPEATIESSEKTKGSFHSF